MRLAGAMAAALLMTGAAYAADPVGTYSVSGTNPGKSDGYSGTVTVTRTGETYRVVWVVGDTRYIGTGIGDKDFLAVSYRSNNLSGLTLYAASGRNWTGVWANADGREIGTEMWTRR